MNVATVHIDIDTLLELALRGIRRASVFLGLGVNAAIDPEFKDYQLTNLSNIHIIPANLLEHFDTEDCRLMVWTPPLPNGIAMCQSGGEDNHLNEEEESTVKATTIGLDIAKNVFQLHGVDGGGKPVLRKDRRLGCSDSENPANPHPKELGFVPQPSLRFITTIYYDLLEFARRALFSCTVEKGERVSESRGKRKEHGLWQRRFWAHVISDQGDFNTHADHIHWNLVK